MTVTQKPAPLLLLAEEPGEAATTLRFLARFHPGTRVVLADGGGGAPSDVADALALDHRAFPAGTPAARMLRAVLTSLGDPVVLLGGRGALPLMPVLERAAAALITDDAAISVTTAAVAFHAPDPATITATPRFGRALPQQRADLRMQGFARWPFATRRGAVRREHLLAAPSAGRTAPQLAGFAEGLQDASAGRIGLVAEIGFLLVPREIPSPLDVFAASPHIIALTDAVTAELAAHGTADTERLADEIVRWGVAEAIGVPPPQQRGFDTARHALNGTVDRQFEAFEALLRNPPPQLAFAVEAARAAGCPSPPAAATTRRRVRNASRRLDAATLAVVPPAPPLGILALGDGALGSEVWRLLEGRLAEAGLAGAVEFTHQAAEGATLPDWSPGEARFTALGAALCAMEPPLPRFVIWHQGAGQAASAASYRDTFASLYALVAKHLPHAVWLVCRTPGARDGERNAAGEAQEAIIDGMPMCIAGAAADVLDGRFRTGDGALSAEGAGAVADMLADAISRALR